MFAIIKISGKQYKVKPGDVIDVAKLNGKEGEIVSPEVLLVSDGKDIKVGTPLVNGADVKVKIVGDLKGEKINVRRYKHKVRSRRSIGFRSQLTRLEIVSIA
jgi:large subunit ribosomal protein L21